MSLSIALGEDQRLADILAARWTVQEGVHSAESAAALARRHNIEMPITHAVDACSITARTSIRPSLNCSPTLAAWNCRRLAPRVIWVNGSSDRVR